MTEVNISSAFDFLEMAHNSKEDRGHSSYIEFFRGHSDKEWRLLPSIYRRLMLNFEEQLIDEFIRRRPDEFFESDGLFNIISKMQHYGLHTRLLDVTENPAIALYFACCDEFEKDGELFLFQCSLDDIPSNTVLNIVTDFYIRHRTATGHYMVENYYNEVANRYKAKDVETAFYHISNGYYCYSRPKIISERILRQSGSFILFPNDVCPRENCRNERCNHRDSDKCMKNSVEREISKKVKNLSIRGTIHDYTDLHIKNEQKGNRYIIKAENKHRILTQLETIGIKRSFVFPELGNEGMDIMKDYYTRVK